MSQPIQFSIRNAVGLIALDRPKALNSLSLDMVRALTAALLAWRDDREVKAVLIRSTGGKAFCAGGDIRFFHEAGHATPAGGSALLEDFFTEEYALNHLIHGYPKPYIAFMDGIVMGGGMGISQAGPACRLRIVTERTKMAMPEVNIGLFPDVGGSHFLSRIPGRTGAYLALTGAVIGATDALYAGLADVFLPAAQLPAAEELLLARAGSGDIAHSLAEFAAPFRNQADPRESRLAAQREAIDRHFSQDSVAGIMASLQRDSSPFAAQTLDMMRQRSPLMMCVALEQLRRGARMDLADCLRMERSMVRHCFEHGEVLEGVRALAIDKDNAPRWNPPSLQEVTPEMVERFFEPAWPSHAHPLRELE